MDSLWHQIEAQASLMAQFGEMVGGQIYSVSGLRSLVHDLEQKWRGIEPQLKHLEKEYHGIEARIGQFERGIELDLRKVILPRIKVAERELEHIGDVVIPDIRDIALGAEHDLSALKKWITDNIPLIGTTALVGAVTWALGRIGLGGLRCNSLLNSLKNRGCGLWNGLEDLLGLFVDVAIFTNVCHILDFISPYVSDVAAPVVVALTDVGAGICKGSIGAPPPLPPVSLNLPANPGITLHLP
jgi:hypothetical protein